MARSWPIEAAETHLTKLADERGITIHWTDKPPYAYSTHRTVWCNRPTTPSRYLFSLHELGHCADKLARRWEAKADSSLDGQLAELICESHAWAWAAGAADRDLIALIPRSEWSKVVVAGWGSYLVHSAKVAAR